MIMPVVYLLIANSLSVHIFRDATMQGMDIHLPTIIDPPLNLLIDCGPQYVQILYRFTQRYPCMIISKCGQLTTQLACMVDHACKSYEVCLRDRVK